MIVIGLCLFCVVCLFAAVLWKFWPIDFFSVFYKFCACVDVLTAAVGDVGLACADLC